MAAGLLFLLVNLIQSIWVTGALTSMDLIVTLILVLSGLQMLLFTSSEPICPRTIWKTRRGRCTSSGSGPRGGGPSTGSQAVRLAVLSSQL